MPNMNTLPQRVNNMKCPKCESENTQRLEVAFHSGTQNISTTSNTAGVGIGSGG